MRARSTLLCSYLQPAHRDMLYGRTLADTAGYPRAYFAGEPTDLPGDSVASQSQQRCISGPWSHDALSGRSLDSFSPLTGRSRFASRAFRSSDLFPVPQALLTHHNRPLLHNLTNLWLGPLCVPCANSHLHYPMLDQT